uniref:NADH dehydrogenase subunit 6 n=1 Tax=Lamproglena chinensis TaxID=342427 RepID=UPI00286B7905|nr:NADH dehydrogenase subunit 6 [Lamproglena chinensis]WKF18933.1 NADH dehydrogenase subunit 6 [Lamproglena chinensis]
MLMETIMLFNMFIATMTLVVSSTASLAMLLLMFIISNTVILSLISTTWIMCITMIMYLGGLMVLLLYMASMKKMTPALFTPLRVKLIAATSLCVMVITFFSSPNLILSSPPPCLHSVIFSSGYSTPLMWTGVYLMLSMLTTVMLTGNKSAPLNL